MTLFWVIVIVLAVGIVGYLMMKKKKGSGTPQGPSMPTPPAPPAM